MNNIFLIGRPTTDPSHTNTQNNVLVCNFTLAVNRSYKNASGQYETDFINIIAFNKTAELIKSYVHRGDLIAVTGRIQTRNYENKNGEKVYKTEVLAERIIFLKQKDKVEKETNEVPNEKSDPFTEFSNEVIINEADLPF